MAIGFSFYADTRENQVDPHRDSSVESNLDSMSGEDSDAVLNSATSSSSPSSELSSYDETTSHLIDSEGAGSTSEEEVSLDDITSWQEKLNDLDLRYSGREEDPIQIESNQHVDEEGRGENSNTSSSSDVINPKLECLRIDQLFRQQMNSSLIKTCIVSLDGESEIEADDIKKAVKWLLERHSAIFESPEHLREVALRLKQEESNAPQFESTPIRKRLGSGMFKFDEVPRKILDSGLASDTEETRSSFSSQMSFESDRSLFRQDSQVSNSKFKKQFSTASQMSIDEGISSAFFTPSPVRQSSIQSTSTNECIKCRAQSANTFFLPCGHRLLCVTCASPVKRCPLANCARFIRSKVRFFRAKYNA